MFLKKLLISLFIVSLNTSAQADEYDTLIQKALNSNIRPQDHKDQDALRKPDQVIELFGIKPGMVIMDLFAEVGYYTRIISGVVGEDGHVIAHNNKPWLEFTSDNMKTGIQETYDVDNVSSLEAAVNDIELEDNSLDGITIILAYHDFYTYNMEIGWVKIDADMTLNKFYKALKPGGFVGIIDYTAKAGAPRSVGGTLHQIDPINAIYDFEKAGFKLDKTSDILEAVIGPDDDGKMETKSKRFIHRYIKE